MSESKQITLKNVKKFFDFKQTGSSPLGLSSKQENNKLVALDDINFSVSKGESIGIIGINGSGKTTLLRVIGGIYSPDVGSVEVHGRLAPLLQIGAGFQNEIEASENVMAYGLLLGMEKSEIKDKIGTIISFAGLENFSKMKLKHFSSGMRTRLALSTALQTNPDILLVDEVLAVGDIKFREKCINSFLEFKKSKKTILFSTHSIGLLAELADRVIVLDKGKIVAMDEPESAIQKYKKLAGKSN